MDRLVVSILGIAFFVVLTSCGGKNASSKDDEIGSDTGIPVDAEASLPEIDQALSDSGTDAALTDDLVGADETPTEEGDVPLVTDEEPAEDGDTLTGDEEPVEEDSLASDEAQNDAPIGNDETSEFEPADDGTPLGDDATVPDETADVPVDVEDDADAATETDALADDASPVDEDSAAPDLDIVAPQVYLVSIDGYGIWPRLMKIDAKTGKGREVCKLPQSVVGDHYNSSTFSRNGALWLSNNTKLRYEVIDPCTCQFIQEFPPHNAGHTPGITASYLDGYLYGVETVNDNLLKINESTGQTEIIGPLGKDFGTSGATLPADMATPYIYAINGADNALYAIEKATGAATLITGITGATFPAVGMEMHPDDLILYGCTGATTLYQLDTTTGIATAVGTTTGHSEHCNNLAAPWTKIQCLEDLDVNADPFITGTTGDDTLTGDKLYGNDGNDTLNGTTGADELYGNAGNDTILGSDGNDLLFGGAGDDAIWGNKGDDFVRGSTGNDTLYGGQDNDTIMGDDGNDLLYGNKGDDRIEGGGNDDTYYYECFNEPGNDTIFDLWGTDTIVLLTTSGVCSVTSDANSGDDRILTLSDGGSIAIIGGAGAYPIEQIVTQ